jgi:hypothetical protein
MENFSPNPVLLLQFDFFFCSLMRNLDHWRKEWAVTCYSDPPSYWVYPTLFSISFLLFEAKPTKEKHLVVLVYQAWCLVSRLYIQARL